MDTEITIYLYMGGYLTALWTVACILTLFWKFVMEFVSHYILHD